MAEDDSDGLVERTEVLSGERVLADKYEMGACIGEGGMGSVYLAQHRDLQTTVAVKLLGEAFVEHPAAVARFKREARALAATRHENIVTVMDFGTDSALGPYLVMEYLEGESLNGVLGRTGMLEPEMAVEIVCQMLEGLEVVHERGIIHRDLKPANVFLVERPGGRFKVKILDFGISKFVNIEDQDHQTKTGAIVGTPKYLAPEQIHHQSVPDVRTDLYAVGVCLYRMLTGKMPYAARDRAELFDEIVQGKLIPALERRPDLPPELVDAMNIALSVAPEHRYENASEMRHAFRSLFPERTGETGDQTAPSNQIRLSVRPQPARLGSGTASDVRLTPQTEPTTVPRSQTETASGGRTQIAIIALLAAALAAAGGWMFARGGPSGLEGPATAPQVEDDNTPALSGDPIRYGVTQYLGETDVRERHQPFADYLQSELLQPVETVIVADTADLATQVIAGNIDLAALSAYQYVRARSRSEGLRLLARAHNEAGPTYAGVVLARASSGIQELADFEGKTFCWVSPTSGSGYLFPRALFRRAGLDPQNLFRSTTFGGNHDRVLQLLEGGQCDGGAMGAALFYSAGERGFTPSRFRPIATTEEIPYDAYCAGPHVNDETFAKLQEALLQVEPDGDLAREVLGEGDIRGFIATSDADYQSVRDILEYLDEELEGPDPQENEDEEAPGEGG